MAMTFSGGGGVDTDARADIATLETQMGVVYPPASTTFAFTPGAITSGTDILDTAGYAFLPRVGTAAQLDAVELVATGMSATWKNAISGGNNQLDSGNVSAPRLMMGWPKHLHPGVGQTMTVTARVTFTGAANLATNVLLGGFYWGAAGIGEDTGIDFWHGMEVRRLAAGTITTALKRTVASSTSTIHSASGLADGAYDIRWQLDAKGKVTAGYKLSTDGAYTTLGTMALSAWPLDVFMIALPNFNATTTGQVTVTITNVTVAIG